MKGLRLKANFTELNWGHKLCSKEYNFKQKKVNLRKSFQFHIFFFLNFFSILFVAFGHNVAPYTTVYH